jgi:hypothetical protein
MHDTLPSAVAQRIQGFTPYVTSSPPASCFAAPPTPAEGPGE